jgi:hypothetical protein
VLVLRGSVIILISWDTKSAGYMDILTGISSMGPFLLKKLTWGAKPSEYVGIYCLVLVL